MLNRLPSTSGRVTRVASRDRDIHTIRAIDRVSGTRRVGSLFHKWRVPPPGRDDVISPAPDAQARGSPVAVRSAALSPRRAAAPALRCPRRPCALARASPRRSARFTRKNARTPTQRRALLPTGDVRGSSPGMPVQHAVKETVLDRCFSFSRQSGRCRWLRRCGRRPPALASACSRNTFWQVAIGASLGKTMADMDWRWMSTRGRLCCALVCHLPPLLSMAHTRKGSK